MKTDTATEAWAQPTVGDDLDGLKYKLRDIDRREINAVTMRDPAAALCSAFLNSSKCWTVFLKDEPIAMFGVTRISLSSDIGTAWLLSSDKIELIPRTFVKHSRAYVRAMFEETRFNRLENWVHDENEVSKRWLKWCGFTLGEVEPYGYKKEPFRKFWINRQEVLNV